MSKQFGYLFVAAFTAMYIPVIGVSGKEAISAGKIGHKIYRFDLKDTKGQTVSLIDFKNEKAVVVVFIGTECPINNAYMPRLAELQHEYGPRGVQFLAINANRQDSMERVVDHASKFGIPFPVLKDDANVVADQFGARRTPEAFILDDTMTIRYQGRIDDQFGVGYKRLKATTNDLPRALNEVLTGKTISHPSTPVAGCIIGRLTKTKIKGAVTYSKQVSRILRKNCQECHRPGQIGPMPLMTYDDAVAWSETIKEVVDDQRMPPWHADRRFGKFSNDRQLSAEDRQDLLAWIDDGTPEGDERDLPPAKEYIAGWSIGKPDAIFDMTEEFHVPAKMPKGGVPYMDFFVKTHFKEDRWIRCAECKPGALEVVHHIVMYIVPPGVKYFPGNPETPTLTGTAPGDMPLILPPGYAKKLPAGSELVFQMHYTPNGRAQKDRSTVGLVFAKEKPKYEVISQPVANPQFLIPPGADNYEVENWFPFEEDAQILSFMPHMHLRGKDFKYEAIYPDEKTQTLLWVPRYNFNWQTAYRLTKPVVMPKGSRLHCVAHFDNSAKNLNNPNPNEPVKWGDQTWEEMMIGWFDFAYERQPE